MQVRVLSGVPIKELEMDLDFEEPCNDYELDEFDDCPVCKQHTVECKWSGVACTNPDCQYWFCF